MQLFVSVGFILVSIFMFHVTGRLKRCEQELKQSQDWNKKLLEWMELVDTDLDRK